MSSASYTQYQATPAPLHKLSLPNSTFSKVVWEKQFYPLNSISRIVQCAATDGILIAIGSLDGVENTKIYAFEGISGNILWTYNDAFVTVMTEHGLFVGGNQDDILLIRPNDGKIIWQLKLNSTGSIRNMMYKDGLLFVNVNGFYQYFVIDSKGQIVSKHKQESSFYNEYEDVHFVPNLPFGNAARGEFYIRQFGDILYSAAAYTNSTDKPLWESETYSISNFLLYQNYVLWVSPDDKIIKADKTNGQVLDEIEITPSFIFFDNNPDKQHAGYYICGDDKENLIYLLLGDSRQLISISVLE